MNKANLQIRDLTKTFGAKKALSGANLDLREGEIMGLVGPNGAGKTTLIKLIIF